MYKEIIPKIEEIIPKSEFLKQYIQSFSILTNNGDRDINYYIFPQIGSTMVLTNGITTKRYENKIQFSNNSSSRPKVEVFGKYLNPVNIVYQGQFIEFSIDFTAFGINYFLNKPYKLIAPSNFQEVEHSSLLQLCLQINEIQKIEEKVEIAEQYFIEAFKEIKVDYLEKAVTLISNSENISVENVAQQCNTTARTLNRVFNNYIGCSPQTFKKIVKFRKAVNYKLQSDRQVNYTEVCYENDFYDSSHFLRVFKSLTNENPSNFFNSILEMGKSKFPVRFS
ncbi:AraC family transcriptional regulator [Winogradskyella sp.]|uniref:helix-turn-helix domain-containing protein n=1 Tax=Winogradskyella sp. TaxID=1883156 RepID=UPI0025CF6169|nr:AraC family transcriptional regulator [Winogradskyella sp.]MBT8245321.1 AraC family transcriptional regulator [Winogradskyella sp.]